jgi:uncharacterized protein (DUF2236 family)
MATIITRELGATAKGSPLSNAEVDNNFINLNTEVGEKAEIASNLADLQSIPTARTNLQVYSQTETVDQAIAMAIALG